MATYYEEGKGEARNLDLALQWYKRAQESGFHAEKDIAGIYGEQGNLIEAHSWFTHALEAGDGSAAEELGDCYTFGGCKGYCGWKNPCTSNFYQAYV